MLDQTFDPPEARRVDDELQPRRDFDRAGFTAGHVERHDAAESTHLFDRDLVAGVAQKPGIVHRLDMRMLFERFGKDQRRRRLALDPVGRVWVADRNRGDLQLIDMRKQPFRHELTFKPKNLNGEISGVAADATGRVHVLTNRGTVYVYRPIY